MGGMALGASIDGTGVDVTITTCVTGIGTITVWIMGEVGVAETPVGAAPENGVADAWLSHAVIASVMTAAMTRMRHT